MLFALITRDVWYADFSQHMITLRKNRMNSELLSEELIGLAAAGKMLPGSRGAKSVSTATLFRWCTDGCKSATGERVRLEHFRAGGRILTTRQAVLRFFAALSEVPDAAPVRSPAQRRRDSERAAKELERMGC
jgi:hypothetical protein